MRIRQLVRQSLNPAALVLDRKKLAAFSALGGATSSERGAPVTYRYSFEDLLALLHGHAPAKVDAVALHRRRVEHGHLSVGLKIHCLGDGSQFSTLVEGLGGGQKILDVNYFKHSHASLCLVLPPVGSARSAILLLECIEHFIGSAGHAQRADDAVRPRQPSPERVRVKAPADLRNCTGKTQGHLFRVGKTFLMQLHRSRPEPRLSTFERCWLGGATGRVRSPWRSGQATRATYSRSRSPDQSARSA